MASTSRITIIQDSVSINKAYMGLIKRHHDVRLIDVGAVNSAHNLAHILDCHLIIIQVNLNDSSSVKPLKEIMARPERSHIPTLFLLREFSRREIVQANTIGATDYTAYPCPDDNLMFIINDLLNDTEKKAWERLTQTQEEALKVSLKVVEKTFHNASKGLEVSQEEVKDSCSLIIEATAKDGLSDWMNAIRQHHDYTYRHSMMVCGYLISFGMLLGVKKSDLQLLAVGGMLHDIGKARVSLDILNKPSELTCDEWTIIKKHPGDGRDILTRDGWDEVMVDIAAHHHEKLDGSGYPDGLKGNQINDIVRIASIANVFSGLTDKRAYKPAMTAESAIAEMLAMKGHLDLTLVKAFRPVVLMPASDVNDSRDIFQQATA